MTLHPCPEEQHDWSRDQHGAASKKSVFLTQERLWIGFAMAVAAITFAVIFGPMLADMATERADEIAAWPTACADLTAAECGVRMAEVE